MARISKKQNNIFIPEDPPEGASWIAIGVLFIIPEFITKAIAAYLLYKRVNNASTRKRYQRFRRYANIIGNRGSVSIRELAARMGSGVDVASDLQAMIDQGFIGGNAYIDRSSMMLYMDSDVVETQFVNPTINIHVTPDAAEAPAAKTAAPATEPPKAEAPKAEPRKASVENADFESKLLEIRRLNDEIEDGPVSTRIDRIGELTASIFRVVREKPEHAEEVRKFMNYYLPTTFKLLKSYSLMEKQSYQGENIQAARKKIEEVLDSLVMAFEQQQDRLFKSEALDVETDISVLETMLASDGLLEQKNGLRMRATGAGES